MLKNDVDMDQHDFPDDDVVDELYDDGDTIDELYDEDDLFDWNWWNERTDIGPEWYDDECDDIDPVEDDDEA